MSKKDDKGKLRPSLVPIAGIRAVQRILEFGVVKYSKNGWKTVPEAKERYTEALLRHAEEVSMGLSESEDPFVLDPESGLPHLAHIACNALFLLYFHEKEQDK